MIACRKASIYRRKSGSLRRTSEKCEAFFLVMLVFFSHTSFIQNSRIQDRREKDRAADGEDGVPREEGEDEEDPEKRYTP